MSADIPFFGPRGFESRRNHRKIVEINDLNLSKSHISRVGDYTVIYTPQLGAYMCKYMWIVPRTRGIYVEIYVKLPRVRGKMKYIHHLNGIYVMYIRCLRGIYPTI